MARVCFGGPVQGETGWLVHEPIGDTSPDGGTVEVAPGIALSMSLPMLRRLAAQPPVRLRFFMGYAGWGAGQLADEMVAGCGSTPRPLPSSCSTLPPEDMWHAALRSISDVDPGAIVPATGIN